MDGKDYRGASNGDDDEEYSRDKDFEQDTQPTADIKAEAALRDWRTVAEEIAASQYRYINQWETEFLESLLSNFYDLSEKQEVRLRAIARKCHIQAW